VRLLPQEGEAVLSDDLRVLIAEADYIRAEVQATRQETQELRLKLQRQRRELRTALECVRYDRQGRAHSDARGN
jgi:hypothetical protein